MLATPSLPYGTLDLDPGVAFDPGPPRRVRCYVRGCAHWLRTPTRLDAGDMCPDHGIRCHSSGYGATYTYPDVRRNIIIDADLLATRIVAHPFKYESHRLGNEKSEDALTWNVFRSLQAAGCLHTVARRITGLNLADPSGDGPVVCPSNGFLRARQKFGFPLEAFPRQHVNGFHPVAERAARHHQTVCGQFAVQFPRGRINGDPPLPLDVQAEQG
jgi:hypothetical protein